MKILTLKDVVNEYKLCYSTVYKNRYRWGFFQLDGTKKWLIYSDDLEKNIKKGDNHTRLTLSNDEEKQCQYTKEMVCITSILPRQVENELDALLKQKIERKH